MERAAAAGGAGGEDGKSSGGVSEVVHMHAGLSSLLPLQRSLSEGLIVLNLHANAIVRIEGLGNCKNLAYLNLSSNEISRMEGLHSLGKLEELNLAANGIRDISGCEGLFALRILVLSYNQIQRLAGLACLHGTRYHLEHLDIKDNVVDRPSELRYLSGCMRLKQLSLRGGNVDNPVCRLSSYVPSVMRACPDLQGLDGEICTDEMRLAGTSTADTFSPAASTSTRSEKSDYELTARPLSGEIALEDTSSSTPLFDRALQLRKARLHKEKPSKGEAGNVSNSTMQDALHTLQHEVRLESLEAQVALLKLPKVVAEHRAHKDESNEKSVTTTTPAKKAASATKATRRSSSAATASKPARADLKAAAAGREQDESVDVANEQGRGVKTRSSALKSDKATTRIRSQVLEASEHSLPEERQHDLSDAQSAASLASGSHSSEFYDGPPVADCKSVATSPLTILSAKATRASVDVDASKRQSIGSQVGSPNAHAQVVSMKEDILAARKAERAFEELAETKSKLERALEQGAKAESAATAALAGAESARRECATARADAATDRRHASNLKAEIGRVQQAFVAKMQRLSLHVVGTVECEQVGDWVDRNLQVLGGKVSTAEEKVYSLQKQLKQKSASLSSLQDEMQKKAMDHKRACSSLEARLADAEASINEAVKARASESGLREAAVREAEVARREAATLSVAVARCNHELSVAREAEAAASRRVGALEQRVANMEGAAAEAELGARQRSGVAVLEWERKLLAAEADAAAKCAAIEAEYSQKCAKAVASAEARIAAAEVQAAAARESAEARASELRRLQQKHEEEMRRLRAASREEVERWEAAAPALDQMRAAFAEQVRATEAATAGMEKAESREARARGLVSDLTDLVRELRAQLDEAERAVADSAAAAASAIEEAKSQEVARLDSSSNATRAREQLRLQLEEAQRSIEALESERDSIVRTHEQHRRSARHEQERIIDEAGELREALAASRETVANLEERCAKAQEKLDGSADRESELLVQLRELNQKLADANQSLSEVEASRDSLRTRCHALEDSVEEAEEESRRQASAVQYVNSELEDLRARTREADRRHAEELRAVEDAAASAEDAAAAARQQYDDLSRELEEKNKLFLSAEERVDTARAAQLAAEDRVVAVEEELKALLREREQERAIAQDQWERSMEALKAMGGKIPRPLSRSP